LTDLLLDASVWLAALNTESPYQAASHALVESAADGTVGLAALDLTLFEVANVAIRQWRSQRRAIEVTDLIWVACGHALQRVDRDLVRESSMVAAEHGLTVYDAAYVASARRLGAPLVSTDLADLVEPGFAITPEAAKGA
jgi:predicted nucleic acid-binding protein